MLEFFERSKVSSDHEQIREFVKEVRESGFCSFDTEGAGKLPNKPIHPYRRDRLFVAISSLKSAFVLLFHDTMDLPMIPREILADYAIAKIQSGVGGDIELMQAVGVDVRGVVDSGTLLLLLNPGPAESGFGAKRQIRTVWPDKNCHVP